MVVVFTVEVDREVGGGEKLWLQSLNTQPAHRVTPQTAGQRFKKMFLIGFIHRPLPQSARFIQPVAQQNRNLHQVLKTSVALGINLHANIFEVMVGDGKKNRLSEYIC